MKRTVAALSFVAVACGRPAPPPQPVHPISTATTAKATGDGPPAPNEVVRRIIQGGEVFARLASSCETLVVAAGKNPEERALEIDTSETIGCAAKRKTGILFDVTDPKHIKCTGSQHQTLSRATAVVACPLEDAPAESAEPRTNEAVISGVHLFSDREACAAASATATMAHEPTCFEAALVRAVDQRKYDVPNGDFVTRFDTFIDDPSSTVWQRSGEANRVCEPWKIKRDAGGFAFFREWTEKKTTKVRAEVGFVYDATCKRVTSAGQSTTWNEPHAGRASRTSGGWTITLAAPEREDALPLSGGTWFYTRRACERSPR